MHGQRLWVEERWVWVRVGAIDVGHPEVDLALCRIGAKLALAIYYEITSRPASAECVINTQWTHCQNANTFQHVQNIIGSIPSQAGLQMGKWSTQDSFFLKYHYDAGMLFSAAIFHQSIALFAQLRGPGLPPGQKWQFVMAPRPGVGIEVVP
jgi:hypothetical protein